MFEINTIESGIFHIYNRGVNGNNIFHDEQDHWRFLESLRVFNSDLGICDPISFSKRCHCLYPTANRLVEIHQFALLPNHFHMLIQEKTEGGISKFIQRLKTSYSKYINKKYSRRGHFFESTYHSRLINSDSYLEHITRYIHLNPLNLFNIDWKHSNIENKIDALHNLASYRWSSFYYYFNQIDQTFLDLSLLKQFFPTAIDHVKYLFEYQPTDNTFF